jgi:putative sigma-54 modulation protein
MTRKSKAAELDRVYDIAVTGRNVLVTDSMKNYAMEKISKIERFSRRIIDVNVIMDIQKLEHRVDILCLVNNVKFKSSAFSDDMYASIDKAVDKLTEQLRRYKTRAQEHHSVTHEDVAMNVNIYSSALDTELQDLNEELEEDADRERSDAYRPHKIVNVDTMPLRTLTNDEAILKMDFFPRDFMIFRSEEDLKIKAIYRRQDDHYGIIEVEK